MLQQSSTFVSYEDRAGSVQSALYGEDLTNVNNFIVPDSPTAALDLDAIELSSGRKSSGDRVKRRSLGRRVQFDSETKQHDGLSLRGLILDAMVRRYFIDQREVSELDVIDICHKQVSHIRNLHDDLLDILERLAAEAGEEEVVASVPVLPHGGGMCTKLCTPHIPYIKILDRVVEAAAQRALRYSSS